MDTQRGDRCRYRLDVNDDAASPDDASRTTLADEHVGESERSAALDGWVAAFDREMENGDFAASVAAMTAHGCFDVRAVAERWMLANPSGDTALVQVQPALPEPELEPVPEEIQAPAEVVERRMPALEGEPPLSRRQAAATPDIAYFHSLLQGGIERAQLDEAFPGFDLVIGEAVAQYEASAPILSSAPKGPTREDLNGEIREIRQELQASGSRRRRRWRARD